MALHAYIQRYCERVHTGSCLRASNEPSHSDPALRVVRKCCGNRSDSKSCRKWRYRMHRTGVNVWTLGRWVNAFNGHQYHNRSSWVVRGQNFVGFNGPCHTDVRDFKYGKVTQNLCWCVTLTDKLLKMILLTYPIETYWTISYPFWQRHPTKRLLELPKDSPVKPSKKRFPRMRVWSNISYLKGSSIRHRCHVVECFFIGCSLSNTCHNSYTTERYDKVLLVQSTHT